MNIQRHILLLLCLPWVCLSATAQPTDMNDTQQLREYVYQQCIAEEGEDNGGCRCVADALAQQFNTKEWAVFISALNNSDQLPAEVTINDLNSMLSKMEQIDAKCSNL
ncbi:hypothetical protein CUZ56_02398 [Saezia sanguinis]|jgi:hypothetical protein|uniref:Uncharacterized protein n=1 Tax=Saezia sanguinis TaxID=1965230 RepID=A0A433SBD2_9BURK|nr:hypothetical protein [Saezia sanguinis]RUS66040.1 hypothetical protein CUZ56_02398 [Saezia sanguinis]